MLASEALAITNVNNYKNDAVQYGIKELEEKIKEHARRDIETVLLAFIVIRMDIEIL